MPCLLSCTIVSSWTGEGFMIRKTFLLTSSLWRCQELLRVKCGTRTNNGWLFLPVIGSTIPSCCWAFWWYTSSMLAYWRLLRTTHHGSIFLTLVCLAYDELLHWLRLNSLEIMYWILLRITRSIACIPCKSNMLLFLIALFGGSQRFFPVLLCRIEFISWIAQHCLESKQRRNIHILWFQYLCF